VEKHFTRWKKILHRRARRALGEKFLQLENPMKFDVFPSLENFPLDLAHPMRTHPVRSAAGNS